MWLAFSSVAIMCLHLQNLLLYTPSIPGTHLLGSFDSAAICVLENLHILLMDAVGCRRITLSTNFAFRRGCTLTANSLSGYSVIGFGAPLG